MIPPNNFNRHPGASRDPAFVLAIGSAGRERQEKQKQKLDPGLRRDDEQEQQRGNAGVEGFR